MEAVYLDTHVIVWLFSGKIDKLSSKAIDLIENNDLFISPIVMLELEYLYEIGRLRYRHGEILSSLSDSIDLKVCQLPFVHIVSESTHQNWTRDPFDRLIVSNAICNDNATLLSKDEKIRNNYTNALWD